MVANKKWLSSSFVYEMMPRRWKKKGNIEFVYTKAIYKTLLVSYLHKVRHSVIETKTECYCENAPIKSISKNGTNSVYVYIV